MKYIELIESQDDINNPLGKPPVGVKKFTEYLGKLEHEFAIGMYGENLGGNEYVQSLKEIDDLGHVTKLSIKKLIPIEDVVSKTHLRALMTGATIKTSSEEPKVYLYKNKYYLTDGNHRVAAEFLKGSETVTVLLIDVEVLEKYVRSFKDI